ncbi:Transcription repressor [Forsythia ovata]|uniref:Transcription repressor n=1 Tax=Forsythia ovata TaxID=205694 RepID=A0ABD1X163_9LAMI
MENHFKIRFYRMFRSSLVSCKSKNAIDDIEDPTFIPKTLKNRQHYQLIELVSPTPRPFPFMCRPKWPDSFQTSPSRMVNNKSFENKLSDERKCLVESNKKTTKKSHFSEFRECSYNGLFSSDTTKKCGISNGIRASKSREARSRRARRKIAEVGLMPFQGVTDSLAVVKRSSDPYSDFRTSMVEMIVEKQIFTAKELENLLQCFLSLNSYHHHRIIIQVFSEIWEALFESYVLISSFPTLLQLQYSEFSKYIKAIPKLEKEMSSSEHSDSHDENHSDAYIQRNGGSENSGKEKIEFTKDGLGIVPKDAKLSRYLGSLERTRHCPQGCQVIKNKVEKNVENRKQLKMSHTSGTKSFVRHLDEFVSRKEQKYGPIETFNLVHKRKDKHKNWIDYASEQILHCDECCPRILLFLALDLFLSSIA